MARPLTAEDVEAIAAEAWDATMAAGNVPWAELGADTKSRYRDITIDACRYGGASGEFELKCQELWVVAQETPPPEPLPDPEADAQALAAAESASVLPEGTDLTPGNLAKAIRALEGDADEPDRIVPTKRKKKSASGVWAEPLA